MSMVFSIKDSLRQSVEAASGGKNTVLYDDKGNPSVMVVIPRFKLSDIDSTWSNSYHPAFDVNGVSKKEIFISKYHNVVYDNRAYSIPGVDPRTSVNFDQAKSYCENKGDGWHLFSNAEWSAVALWSLKNDTQPRGNNCWGCDYSCTWERGVIADETVLHDGKFTRTKTGSGPDTWSHDHTPFGIFGLNGNIWDWVSGMKMKDGKMWVVGDNGVARNNFRTSESYGSTNGFIDLGYSYNSSSNIVSGANENDGKYYGKVFKSITGGTTLMQQLCLAPVTDSTLSARLKSDYFYHQDTHDERIPLRGGAWNDQSSAGLFYLHLHYARSLSSWIAGFRAAYIS